MSTEQLEQTIEESKQDGLGYSVYEFDEYPPSSVLAGQTRKSFLDAFDTIEEAQKEYPNATVGYRDPHNYFDHLPDTPDY